MTTTLGLSVTSIGPDELEEWVRAEGPTFGYETTERDVNFWRSIADYERMLAIYDEGRIVATAEAQSFTMTVPGGTVPLAGFTTARVLPSHRRQGLMSMLNRHRMDQAREHGQPMAGLWGSEAIIRGRWIFGWATTSIYWTLEAPYMRLQHPIDTHGRVRLIDPDDVTTVLPPIYERARPRTPGMLDRNAARWRDWVTRDPWHWQGPEWQQDVGPRVFATWEDRGYVAYRVQRRWPHGAANYRLLVAELIAADDEAYAGLWQWCFELDLVRSVAASQRPVDEPLRFMLVDPRRFEDRSVDALRLRPVDPMAALNARTYAADGALVIEVVDNAGPWAQGRFRLTSDGGLGECRPTTDTPDVVIPAESLGSAYLGGVRPTRLARAGLADEHTPGALLQLDTMLASSPEPWCPWVF